LIIQQVKFLLAPPAAWFQSEEKQQQVPLNIQMCWYIQIP
jgi:hypothetical protein